MISAMALAALVAAGCGSGKNESGSTASMTRAEFQKQANAICLKGLVRKENVVFARIEHFSARTGREPTKQDYARLAEQILLPMLRDLVGELATLNPPARQRSRFEKLLLEYESALKTSEQDPMSVVRGNPFVAGDETADTLRLSKCSL